MRIRLLTAHEFDAVTARIYKQLCNHQPMADRSSTTILLPEEY